MAIAGVVAAEQRHLQFVVDQFGRPDAVARVAGAVNREANCDGEGDEEKDFHGHFSLRKVIIYEGIRIVNENFRRRCICVEAGALARCITDWRPTNRASSTRA